MGRRRKWSLAARNPFATIRGRLGPRRKGVEGLCMSSLLGVLRSHTWLIGDEDVALLLDRHSRHQHQRAHSLSFSFCSSSADGGSEDLADPRSPSLDPHLSHVGQGKQIKSLFFFFFKNMSRLCLHGRVLHDTKTFWLLEMDSSNFIILVISPAHHLLPGEIG